MSVDQVRALLGRFQEGYTARDQSKLDEFMALFGPDEDLEVIGTYAVARGGSEWCRGREAVRELVSNDWEYWGDVVYDLENASISIHGDVTWIATTATVTDLIPNHERYAGYLDYVDGTLEDEELTEHAKLWNIVALGNEIVVGMLQGETCKWPFRLTALAVRDGHDWRFHQLHFSFPTTRSPDVRLIEDVGERSK